MILLFVWKTTKFSDGSIFRIFIKNAVAKCHIRSIEWTVDGLTGDTNEEPDFLMEGDTGKVVLDILTPIHVLPIHLSPEFGSFVMVQFIPKNPDILISGKVSEILISTPKLSVIYLRSFRNTVSIFDGRSGIFDKIYCGGYSVFTKSFTVYHDTVNDNMWTRDHMLHLKSQTIYSSEDLIPSFGLTEWQPAFVNPETHSAFRFTNGSLERTLKDTELDSLDIDIFRDNITLTWSPPSIAAVCICNKIGRQIQKSVPMDVIYLIQQYYAKTVYRIESHNHSSRWNPIEELRGRNICKIEKGVGYQLYLEENGTLWIEGDISIKLGYFRRRSLRGPQIAHYFVENGIVIRDISAGLNHHLAVDDQGSVYGWGSNRYGQCGGLRGYKSETELVPISNPIQIDFGGDIEEGEYECMEIKCGEYHSYVRLRVKVQDLEGNVCWSDKHFLFGLGLLGNVDKQYQGKDFTSPLFINQIAKENMGGDIEQVFVSHGGIFVAVKQSYYHPINNRRAAFIWVDRIQ